MHPANLYTSLQIECQQQQSVQYSSHQQYIESLKSNSKVVWLALRKAEDLIRVYQHENEELKSRNKFLERKLAGLENYIEYLKQIFMENKGNKMEDKLANLSLRNQKVEKMMSNLTKQLQKSQTIAAKLTRFKQQKAEESLHSYFQFGRPKTSRNSSSQEQLNREIRSLKLKLQKKEQEIVYMMRRNKFLEEKHDRRNKSQNQSTKFCQDQRFYSCQTQPNNVPYQSK